MKKLLFMAAVLGSLFVYLTKIQNYSTDVVYPGMIIGAVVCLFSISLFKSE